MEYSVTTENNGIMFSLSDIFFIKSLTPPTLTISGYNHDNEEISPILYANDDLANVLTNTLSIISCGSNDLLVMFSEPISRVIIKQSIETMSFRVTDMHVCPKSFGLSDQRQLIFNRCDEYNIHFLIDQSGSMSAKDFLEVKMRIEQLLAMFDSAGINISIKYSDLATGLELSRDELYEERDLQTQWFLHHDRQDDLTIIFTDGLPNVYQGSKESLAKSHKDLWMHLNAMRSKGSAVLFETLGSSYDVLLNRGCTSLDYIKKSIELAQDCATGIVNLYPNPTQGTFVVRDKYNGSELRQILIYHLGGSLAISSVGTRHVDISNLPSGNYRVKLVYSDGHVVTSKIVKI